MTPLKVRAGDDYSLSLTWREPNQEDGSPGDPINLTGYTFVWHVAVGAISNDFTGSPEIVVTTPSTGVITMTIPHSITSTYDTAKGRHWLKVTSGGGIITTLLIGDVDVEFDK